ncbi:ComEC/Rec2 family competence protein [Candidatus Uhrbacteria bacterium]|nr:ComEC/Rec2 family competence protein [Candidatus Uhrbacteria bacterium]
MFTRYRIFRYALGSFLIGVAVASLLPLGIFEAYVGMLGAMCIGVLGRNILFLRITALCVGISMLGILRVGISAGERFFLPEHTPFAFAGTVIAEPTLRGYFQTASVDVIREGESRGIMRIRLPMIPEVRVTDVVQGTCTTLLPEWRAPGGRLFPPLCTQSTTEIQFSSRPSFWRILADVRHSFQDVIDRGLSPPASDLLGGLLLGVQQTFSATLKEDFRRSGVSHIVAVSGFNITIIIAALWSVFKRTPLGKRRSFWLLGGGVVLFVCLTGAAAATVRAAVMGLLVLFGESRGRLSQSGHALFIAAAAMVAWDPALLLFNVGFQLSIAATAGLIGISPIIEPYVRALPSWAGLKDIGIQTLSAFIATTPIITGMFHTFSFVAIPANLLIVPLVPMTMAAGFVWGVAATVAHGWFIDLLALPAVALLNAIIALAQFFSHLPFAQVSVSLSAPHSIAVVVGGYLLLGIVVMVAKRQLRLANQEGTIAA